MFRIESITIANFRGIPDLTLALNRQSFGICGNNGTGKSGVVDAIEFGLTGSISRLSGRGTSGLSVKQHGPHVDHRHDPGSAKVTLKLYFPELKKSATIERNLKSPNDVVVTPPDKDIQAIVDRAASHPEIALSRREILKYVLTEPGERSKEIQALLKLDAIEKMRAALQTVANAQKAEHKRCESEVAATKRDLLAALKIEQIKVPSILAVVNERRTVLSLPLLSAFTADTSLKEGILQATAQGAVNKVAALEDLASLHALLTAEDEACTKSRRDTIALQAMIEGQPALLASLRKRAFVSTGLSLLEDELCPLCDLAWDPAALRAVLQRKLEEAKEAERLQNDLAAASTPIRDTLAQLTRSVKACVAISGRLEPMFATAIATTWLAQIDAMRTSLVATEGIALTRAALGAEWRCRPEGVTEWIDTLTERVNALPDVSAQEVAREYLILAQERLEKHQKALRAEEHARKNAAVAMQAAEAFGVASKRILTGVYDQVEADFAEFYRAVNRADEEMFQAKLTPAQGKLTLDVDFYKRGMFPPGAYHSEGHQDGMGLCLYLALMRRLLGPKFGVAVLDDVVMSVDAGHRKEVCKLLKAKFPDTQFVITTHDPVWLQHMVSERILASKAVIRFKNWTVEDGPQPWEYTDIWADIAQSLAAEDVRGAAAALRHYLEFASTDLADRLRAQVEFSASDSYDLGDLLPSVVHRWSALLKSAKEAAQSWGKTEAFTFNAIQERHDAFRQALDRSNVEHWAINATVHHNAWATLHPDEFRPVVDAFRELLASFQCGSCGAYFYVVPPKGNTEAVRCDCGSVTLNLKKKS